MLTQLQQQLGGDFTQQTLSDNLHTDFVKRGGGLPTFVVAAIAVAASFLTAGATAVLMGTTLTTMTLGQSIVVAAVSGMGGTAASEVASGNGLDPLAILEAGAVAAITAGLTNGITYNSTTGAFGLGNLNQGLNSLPQDTSTLGQLAGMGGLGNALSGTVTQAGETAAQSLPQQLAALGATATISAGVQTAIEGGSFLKDLENAGTSELAAAGAYAIGNAGQNPNSFFAQGSIGYDFAHAALGCAASAAEGTGCAGGAIGGAVSAAFSPDLVKAIDPTGAPLDPGQQAALAAFATLAGGGLAGLAGVNVNGAMTAAQNEALNNTGDHAADAAKKGGLLNAFGTWLQNTYGDPIGSLSNWGNQFLDLVTSNRGQTPPSDPNNQLSGGSSGNPPNTGAAPVTPPTVACVPGAGCVVTPPLVSPGSPNNTPGKAILSSGNSGNDGGSATGQGPSTNSAVSQADLDALAANGVKFTPQNVVATGATPGGQIVFLETGNSGAGLQHIVDGHASDFANIGVSEAQIPGVVMQAVTEGNIVGYQGSGTGRPIYQTTINGQPQRIAVTIGSNGFIVGANPAGRGK